MFKPCLCVLLFGVSLLGTVPVLAGSEPWFTPLQRSARITVANSPEEQRQPFLAPPGLTQTNITSLSAIERHVEQSVQRVSGLGVSAAMFDMLSFSADGRFIFIPHETLYGAGLSRYDRDTQRTELLFVGDQRGRDENWSMDFGSFDPARLTPNETVWLAEEWSGLGRVVEILNPYAAAPLNPVASARDNWRVLTTLARVSHEGIGFSRQDRNRTVYYVDEDRSGSIYKWVMSRPGDYMGGGQTFVLVTAPYMSGQGDPAGRWDSGPNRDIARIGEARWVAITDPDGGDLESVTNPFDNSETDSTRPGRVAADDVRATPYGRPEDVEVGVLANGNEVLYFTATAEHVVYSVEMVAPQRCIVREFARAGKTPRNLGFAATSASLQSPDNLAQDALGNIYLLEDAAAGSGEGGDVWFVRDTNGDGVAESLDQLLSLRVHGAEATGMVFDPVNPARFVISVQHPSSTGMVGATTGFGDAIWQFDLLGGELNQSIIAQLRRSGGGATAPSAGAPASPDGS